MFQAGNAGVRDHDALAAQHITVLLQKDGKTLAPYFFFAFNDETQIARQVGVGLQISFDSFEVSEVLAFIITRAASVESLPFDARLERRRFPQLKWLGGLNVVVPINHEVLSAAASRGLSEDDGMAGRFDQTRAQADLIAMVGQPLGAGFQIRFVLRLSGDTGKTDVVAQFLYEAMLVFLEVVEHGLHRGLSTNLGARKEVRMAECVGSTTKGIEVHWRDAD